jgi:hypothetical protein
MSATTAATAATASYSNEVTRCPALIQQGPKKGQTCGKKAIGTYCVKHARQAIQDKAVADAVRYCDVARGCFVVLDPHQNKCTACLHKARIQERKRNDKKRADPTLCLDCGNTLTPETQAKGKRDRGLRRCAPCYEKLLKVEEKRPPRQRNYKAEAFANKHVIWNHYVKGAKKRGIHFELKKTDFEAMIVAPCFYCQHQTPGEVNGIDRLDNHQGYVEGNTVACCSTCNDAKGTQHPMEFIDKLCAIQGYRGDVPITAEVVETWKATYLSRIVPSYRTYTKSANARSIPFQLTEEQFAAIVQAPCYLCGLETSDRNHNGIDRVNNAEGYTLDNAKACCGHCNLMKRSMELAALYRIAERVEARREVLATALAGREIAARTSKVAGRARVEEPATAAPVPMEYKSLEEETPQKVMSKEIPQLEKAAPVAAAAPVPKQWKSTNIYRAIQQNLEDEYKAFCEESNDMTLLPTWSMDWATFVLSVKGRSEAEALPVITAFVENLRRVRHNKLCYDRNAGIVDKVDRQQWPATTVVRAFLDGKISGFKAFMEATGEDPADPKWVKRWTGFIQSLEDAGDAEKMKTLCSKFMTAQRTKRYRAKALKA